MRRWLAGTLATLPAAMSFLTPNVNSFRRLVELTGPPTTVTWGEDNKSAALRTITRDPATARIEHRVPSAGCNVYLAPASALAGAWSGSRTASSRRRSSRGWRGCCRQAVHRGCPIHSSAPRPRWRPTGASPRCSVRTWSTTGSGAGSREWLAFHTGGGDPDQVGEFELRRYFETA
jgi:glutamine synthetase